MEAAAARAEKPAAGLLADIFALDVATAQAHCGGCGGVSAVGALPAYGGAMGAILRCPDCDTAMLRVALIRGTYRLDLRGTQSLHIPIAAPPAPAPPRPRSNSPSPRRTRATGSAGGRLRGNA
jgi:hypothetical protein